LQKYFIGLLKRYKKQNGSDKNVATTSDVDRVTGLPKKNDKGWTLETDGAGTYLYVSPDRKSFDKVE
jgi:hypothetical protein